MNERMKPWLCVKILCCLLFLWQSVGLAAESQFAPVTVCGEAVLSSAEAHSIALEDAKRKAVQKTLARIISPSQEPSSAFQHILGDYKRYVSSTKIIKEEKVRGTLYLISKVEVDVQRLNIAVKESVKTEKQLEADDTIYFFIRVKGFPSGMAENNAQVEVARIYNDSFQAFGFETANEDAQNRLIAQQRDLAFDDYVKSMERALDDRVEVMVAVIGEIEITPIVEDVVGCSVNSVLRIKAIDLIDRRVITEFNDVYQLRRSSREEAYKFILDKSAFNSSKVLAKETLNYWKINHKA